MLGQGFEIAQQFLYEGGTPRAPMVAASDGSFYGVDDFGGDFSVGAIFRLTPDGSGGFTSQVLWSFHGPDGAYPRALMQAADSKFYGIAQLGGQLLSGTAFVFDPISGSLVRLHNFEPIDSSAYTSPSGLLQAADGQLYGVIFHGGAQNLGTLYRLSPSGDFSVLHDFQGPEGAGPFGALMQASDGYVYGTTVSGGDTSGGVIFRADLSGTVERIHNFIAAEATAPNGALVEGLDGNLYGTSFAGGSGGGGTVFRSDKAGNVTVLFSFPSPDGGSNPNAGLSRAADGSFYGTTEYGGPGGSGIVFHITTEGDLTTVASLPIGNPLEIAHPVAGVTLAPDGSLWGTAADGGLDNAGGVFRIPLPDTTPAILFECGSGDVALFPTSALTETSDGGLWGSAAGTGPFGTVFRLSTASRPVLVHTFLGDPDGDGSKELWAGTDGNLYGTTSQFGPNGAGTVFRLDPSSGALTTLHGFAGSDGGEPEAGLIQGTDGNFYGSTYAGGAFGAGTLFRMDLKGSLTTLVDLGSTDQPGSPVGRLVQASDGNLYGASLGGGASSSGTLFSSDLSGSLTTLHSFDPGAYARSGLIQADDGNFYGGTAPNGPESTIYRIDSSGAFTTIHSFVGNSHVLTALLQASDGRLYGTTVFNPSIFRLDPSGENFETIRELGDRSGSLMQATDGMLYGTSAGGGWDHAGFVYRLDLSNSPPTIESISPTSGRAAGGVIVTIAGEHFHPDLTTVPNDSSPFNAHMIFNATPAFPAGSLNDYTVTNTDGQSATLPGAFFADFLDAPGDNQFHAEIEAIFRNGITAGCGGGNYCTDAPASRAQMAVLLLKVEHGPAYVPPPCLGVFPDVVCPSLFADWIEQFAAEEISAGCGDGNYCPGGSVTRAQVAVFILKYEHGSAYVPPLCAGIFGDVACPSQFANWIEQFAAEKITVGCGDGNYCPDIPTTRGQMAVFLTRALTLP